MEAVGRYQDNGVRVWARYDLRGRIWQLPDQHVDLFRCRPCGASVNVVARTSEK